MFSCFAVSSIIRPQGHHEMRSGAHSPYALASVPHLLQARVESVIGWELSIHAAGEQALCGILTIGDAECYDGHKRKDFGSGAHFWIEFFVVLQRTCPGDVRGVGAVRLCPVVSLTFELSRLPDFESCNCDRFLLDKIRYHGYRNRSAAKGNCSVLSGMTRQCQLASSAQRDAKRGNCPTTAAPSRPPAVPRV